MCSGSGFPLAQRGQWNQCGNDKVVSKSGLLFFFFSTPVLSHHFFKSQIILFVKEKKRNVVSVFKWRTSMSKNESLMFLDSILERTWSHVNGDQRTYRIPLITCSYTKYVLVCAWFVQRRGPEGAGVCERRIAGETDRLWWL